MIEHVGWEHAAVHSESLADGLKTAGAEMFDDHEKHGDRVANRGTAVVIAIIDPGSAKVL